MNSAIAATIPLLTAPLADICSPSALDSLHVILMSTLSEHLAPTWDAARPSLGAASRVLHISASSSANPPRTLAVASFSAGIKASSWVALLLAHYRGSSAMSISIDPGMVAIQFAESPRPVVYWQEDVSPVSSRAVSPTSERSSHSSSSMSSMSASAEAPWNARKSRLPSLVAASARQANPASHPPAALPFGTPRTPQSFAGFSFPPQSQSHLPTNDELFGEGHQGLERRWLGQVLDLFPETPEVSEEMGMGMGSGSKLNASAPVYRPPHARPSHSHSRTDSTSSYSSSSSSSSSSTRSSPSSRSDSRRPTLTPASVAAAAAAAHAHAHQGMAMMGGIYGQLSLNMSQLSLASTSSAAPSLSSASSASSSSSSASSYRAASPASDNEQLHSYSLTAPAPGSVKYMDADLPSPLSPTASAYAYVDHSARRDVTEYECGKVGVLGGAVMLGVPAHKKRNSGSAGNGKELPKRGAVPTW